MCSRSIMQNDSPKREIEAAKTINRALMENGEINTKELIGQTLERKEMQQEAIELLERYGLGNSTIQPENENTRKKLYFQTLKTETGIELKIPIPELNGTASSLWTVKMELCRC